METLYGPITSVKHPHLTMTLTLLSVRAQAPPADLYKLMLILITYILNETWWLTLPTKTLLRQARRYPQPYGRFCHNLGIERSTYEVALARF